MLRRIRRPINSSDGSIMPFATVQIKLRIEDSLATLWSEEDASVVLSDVGIVRADASGYIDCYLMPAEYTATLTSADGTETGTEEFYIEPANAEITDSSTSRTISEIDAGNWVTFTNESSIQVDLESDSATDLPINTVIYLRQSGGGQITVAAESTVTLDPPENGFVTSAAEGATLQLKKRAANYWQLSGHTAENAGGGGGGGNGTWEQVGNAKSVSNIVDIVALSSTRLALIQNGGANDEISAMDFDGTDLTLTGSAFATGMDTGIGGMAKRSSSSVMVSGYRSATVGLYAFDFGGSTWSYNSGDSNTSDPAEYGDIDELNTTELVFISRENNENVIESYDKSGNWNADSESLTTTELGEHNCCGLTDSVAIAFENGEGAANTILQAYTQNDGVSFPATGNSLTLGSSAPPARNGITKMTTSRIAIVDPYLGELQAQGWDGTDFSELGTSLDISCTGGAAMATFSETRVAVLDINAQTITVYDFTPP